MLLPSGAILGNNKAESRDEGFLRIKPHSVAVLDSLIDHVPQPVKSTKIQGFVFFWVYARTDMLFHPHHRQEISNFYSVREESPDSDADEAQTIISKLLRPLWSPGTTRTTALLVKGDLLMQRLIFFL